MAFVKSAEDLPADFGHVDGVPDPRDKRIAELEVALLPFADMAESYEGERASFVVASKGGTIVSVYDLRVAAKALQN